MSHGVHADREEPLAREARQLVAVVLGGGAEAVQPEDDGTRPVMLRARRARSTGTPASTRRVKSMVT
ncbi:MAG: hypothetical protein ACXW05_09760 [Gemmatirosa sp.]